MRVRVRLFATQREIAGQRTVELELPPGTDVEGAWGALAGRFPGLAGGRPYVRFARNGTYADSGEVLVDGDELACIPPVSGGGPDVPPAATGGRLVLELREAPFGLDILEELAGRLATDDDGAIVGFIGRTRITAGEPAPGQEAEAARWAGRSVESLEYETHEAMALAVLAEIAAEVRVRHGVERLAIVHRVGEVPLGQPAVAIVAASPHRDAAFAAARYAMDETKARAPIWKAEHFSDGHVWVGAVARTGPQPPGPGSGSSVS